MSVEFFSSWDCLRAMFCLDSTLAQRDSKLISQAKMAISAARQINERPPDPRKLCSAKWI
jgi:hypothetical protein